MPRKKKAACTLCAFWEKPEGERGSEEFVYCFGIAKYDVEGAKKIITDSPRDVWEVPTAKLAGFVDYPEGSSSWGTHVNAEHVGHVNMDVPIILAYTIKPRDKDDAPRKLMPIDGSHRIARAVRDNIPIMKCHTLTEEETDKILIDRRPPKRRPPKKK